MKYRSMENRFCMSLVAFAVIVRLLLATGVSAALDSAVGLAPKLEVPDEPDVFLLEILEPETAPSEPPMQPEIAAASEAPAEQETKAEPVDPPLVFSADEADAIGIVGACSYQPDKQALLTRPSALSLSDDGPAVLIVHTHSSEAYTMEAGFEYPESDALRTLDERYSVIRVGDEIADILTEAGISIGDKLNQLRMDEASRLLLETDQPIESIARQIGVENTKYFFVLFKKFKGMTPRQFRCKAETPLL